MNTQRTDATPSRMLLWALAVFVLARLVTLVFYPLMDTSEARYADIARRMVERSDWITPWFTDDQPFWGKPPLSFWATALGFKLFGLNEFGARVPQLILAAAVGAAVWFHARYHSSRAAWHALALLSGCILFMVSAGAVITDMALALGTTLVMVGFWGAMRDDDPHGRRSQLIMALGFIIGLLAKGPVALVLCCVPIGAWLLWYRRLHMAWRRVAWLRGTLLVLVVSLPWYMMAEHRTPGFLNYFLVGEHWHRFVTAGWTGDKYGSAHAFTRGGIWYFALVAVLPWPLLLTLLAVIRRRQGGRPASGGMSDGYHGYLLLWGLWPCVFFTMSGNILWTYVLPALPALAILVAQWTSQPSMGKRAEWILVAGVWVSTAMLIVWVGWILNSGYTTEKSAKSLVMDYRAQAQPGEPLLFLGEVPFSGSFYSDGRAQRLADLTELITKPPGTSVLVVMSLDELNAVPQEMRDQFREVARRGQRVLMRWRPDAVS